MRVLVTGASGFIGGHVTARLDAAGHEVVATGRQVQKLQALALSRGARIPADLSSDDLGPLVAGCDAVIHCAALPSPWGPRGLFIRHNVRATRRLLDATAHGGTVRRFVHVSSPSIYFQPRDQLDIREAFTPPATWPTYYGESKWLAECEVLRPEFRQLGPVILRPRAVYGPGDNAIAPRLLAVARKGFFPLVAGGHSLIDVTYIDNVVDAVELALAAPDELTGQAFNITNGAPVAARDLLREWFAALRLDVRFVAVPRALALALAAFSEWIANLRPGQPEPRLTRYGLGLLSYSQTLNIDAARRQLGYTPAISTSAGIERHAAWYARHG